jgi:hypothetical protein
VSSSKIHGGQSDAGAGSSSTYNTNISGFVDELPPRFTNSKSILQDLP